MTNDALRTILPIAGWPRRAPAKSRSPLPPIRYCRRRFASARRVPPRLQRSALQFRICGNCAPGGASKSRSIRARRRLHFAARVIPDGCGAGIKRAEHDHGFLSREERPLGLSPLQLPEPSRLRAYGSLRRVRGRCKIFRASRARSHKSYTDPVYSQESHCPTCPHPQRSIAVSSPC
jgi:hypothetical protein